LWSSARPDAAALTAADFGERLGLTPLALPGASTPRTVKRCYVGDVLSRAPAFAGADCLFITVRTGETVAAAALLAGAAMVVLAEGQQPLPELVARCRSEGLPLYGSEKSAARLCFEAISLLEKQEE